jgi:hypothetical protein
VCSVFVCFVEPGVFVDHQCNRWHSIYKIGERYSQAQQCILQLYKCHRMLVFM